MYTIIFYEDSRGNSTVLEYLNSLDKKRKTNKDSRIKFNKIVAYLDILSKYGPNTKMPIARQLTQDIWELRPLSDRIMYAYFKNEQFVVLHSFTKKTAKTPKRELEKAIRNYKDFIKNKERENEKLDSSKKRT